MFEESSLSSSNCATSLICHFWLHAQLCHFWLHALVAYIFAASLPHRWLHAQNTLQCLPTRQTSTYQSFLEPLTFAYEFYYLKIYNFISVSQTQIRDNPDNLDNVERYSLVSK